MTADARVERPTRLPLGPVDDDELDPEHPDGVERTDFGSLRLPVPQGGVVDVPPSGSAKLQAVQITLPEGMLSVSVLAAPTTDRLWPDLAKEINASLRGAGARVRSVQGRWGRELRARTGDAVSVFVGVDGPRWMVYGVATGPANQARMLDRELRRLLGSTVVVRGRSPYPVRTVLPLDLPEELQAEHDARAGREQEAADALEAQQAEREAAERAAQERVAQEQQAAERAAAERASQEARRQAAERAAQEAAARRAAEQAAADRAAQEQAARRHAAEQAAAQAAAEQAARRRAEQAAAEQAARRHAAAERAAQEAAARRAAEQAAAERAAQEQASARRLAAARFAAERGAQDRPPSAPAGRPVPGGAAQDSGARRPAPGRTGERPAVARPSGPPAVDAGLASTSRDDRAEAYRLAVEQLATEQAARRRAAGRVAAERAATRREEPEGPAPVTAGDPPSGPRTGRVPVDAGGTTFLPAVGGSDLDDPTDEIRPPARRAPVPSADRNGQRPPADRADRDLPAAPGRDTSATPWADEPTAVGNGRPGTAAPWERDRPGRADAGPAAGREDPEDPWGGGAPLPVDEPYGEDPEPLRNGWSGRPAPAGDAADPTARDARRPGRSQGRASRRAEERAVERARPTAAVPLDPDVLGDPHRPADPGPSAVARPLDRDDDPNPGASRRRRRREETEATTSRFPTVADAPYGDLHASYSGDLHATSGAGAAESPADPYADLPIWADLERQAASGDRRGDDRYDDRYDDRHDDRYDDRYDSGRGDDDAPGRRAARDGGRRRADRDDDAPRRRSGRHDAAGRDDRGGDDRSRDQRGEDRSATRGRRADRADRAGVADRRGDGSPADAHGSPADPYAVPADPYAVPADRYPPPADPGPAAREWDEDTDTARPTGPALAFLDDPMALFAARRPGRHRRPE